MLKLPQQLLWLCEIPHLWADRSPRLYVCPPSLYPKIPGIYVVMGTVFRSCVHLRESKVYNARASRHLRPPTGHRWRLINIRILTAGPLSETRKWLRFVLGLTDLNKIGFLYLLCQTKRDHHVTPQVPTISELQTADKHRENKDVTPTRTLTPTVK